MDHIHLSFTFIIAFVEVYLVFKLTKRASFDSKFSLVEVIELIEQKVFYHLASFELQKEEETIISKDY